ncbi:WXG100 family type VII secretion target [Actinoplanes lutulentus]|uniref:WXG100 family type VII secretion target n=1 Tax=Actinoplanes lutulentus TaxID=1287878 RepID=A0A327ZKW0_9ACTN|nr:WXG100 family type VII secretion target [Actinoplanes lutulentus]MBB2940604.1 WXG100 family type VII secretion target [Actinoplanes lutulentus]RAK42915.1 WXG100 family type VII secretion target [Actinoplanes lutulentus]
MSDFSVRPSMMVDTIEQINAIQGRIDAAMGELNSSVNTFVSVNAGAAVEEYQLAQAEWNAGLEQMRASLSQAGVNLNSILSTYEQGQRTGVSIFSSGR